MTIEELMVKLGIDASQFEAGIERAGASLTSFSRSAVSASTSVNEAFNRTAANSVSLGRATEGYIQGVTGIWTPASKSIIAGADSIGVATKNTGNIFTNTLSAMGNGVNAVGSAIGKGFTGIRDEITRLADHAKWASFMFGSVLVGAIGSAVSMAANFERFGIAAEYLTGSATAAKEFASAVKEVAVSTMFNVDQIAQMESRLVGNTRDIKQSTTALKAMTEAVAATGGGFTELESSVRAWIQINSKANLSSEELNRQFANANIPVVRLLAESIAKDLNHPMREYLEIAGSATGVSSTLANSYKTASGNIDKLAANVRIAEAGLKVYNETGKKDIEQTLRHEEALRAANAAYGAAKGTIGEYTTAMANSGKATGAAKLSVEQIMEQLQNVGLLKIPGTIGAAAVTRALEEAYGGANAKLINTFSGQVSMLGDVLKITALRFMGLDESFKPTEKGLLNLLTNVLKPMVKYLQDNQESIAAFAEKVSTSTPVLVALGAMIVGVLIPAIIGLILPLVKLGFIFSIIGAAIGGMVYLFQENKAAFYGITAAVAGFGAALVAANITAIIAGIGTAMAPIVAVFAALISPVGLIILAITALAAAIIIFWPQISKFFIDLPKNIQAAWTAVGTFISNTWNWIVQSNMNSINTIITGVGNFVTSLVTFFTELPGKIWAVWYNFWVVTVPYAVGYFIGWMLTAFPQFLMSTLTSIWTFITNANTAIGTFVTVTVPTAITGFITWMLKSMADFGINLLAWLIVTGVQFVWNIVDMGEKTVKEISTWPKRIMDWLNTLPGLVKTMFTNLWASFTEGLGNIWNSITSWSDKVMRVFNDIRGAIQGALDLAAKAFSKGIATGAGISRQHGGMVPGLPNQAVPIIAHGGERVVPSTGADANGGRGMTISVNFYGGVALDSEERINELAKRITSILGRQNELAQYGISY